MGLLDLLFPRECVGCRKTGEYLCSACKKTLYAHPEICPFCHKPSADFQTCFGCKAQEDALAGILIGFSYQTLIKKLILKVKFGHKKDIVPFLAGRLALLVQTHGKLSGSDQLFISFIPSHRRRKYLEKGYNQSELLAKELANQLNLPILPLVKKVKYTVSQLKLKREERKKNLEQVFVSYPLDKLPRGATVLFVDDVTTTGSTLLQIAKVIKQEREDVNIWGAVLARNMQ
ncbi:MAG: double zinc ribbon domain-containing protein [Candidatus Peribacteria bacterium]|jgi:ComF family protein|nr:double zinc ribbon domain-containing protein [Candidatus Peribacteria bacterium]